MNNQLIYSILLALAAFFCMASWHHASEEKKIPKAENFSEERVQESIRKTDEFLSK